MIKDVKNTAEFDAAIAEGTVLVDFWATWCGPCRVQGEILEKQVAAEKPDLAIVKVNIDENMELAARYGIQSIPALRIFKDGQMAAAFDGVTRPGELYARL